MTIEFSNESENFQEFEHRGWETISDGYEQHFAPLTHQAVPATLDAAAVREGMRVLDVCAGPGMLSAAAADRGARVIGLDFSAKAVEIARRNVSEAGFQEGDAQALPFEDESFDAVVSGFGVIHVPHPELALSEMRRVLKSGGRVAISTWAAPEPAAGLGLLFGAIKTYGDLDVPLPHGPDFFQFSDEASMTGALSQTGFRDIAVHEVEQVWELSSSKGILTAIMEGTVRTRGLLEAQTEAVRNAIWDAVEVAMRRYVSPDGFYRVPMPALVGAAAK